MFVPMNLENAFLAYVQVSQLVTNETENLLIKVQPSEPVEDRVVQLRQDLDLEKIELETRLKLVLATLQMTPCDKAARENAWELLGDINTKTTEIPNRVNS